MKDYYRILQVHPQADPEVIQAAYRRLARKYHPDANEGADDAAMQELNEAYAVLSDPQQRALYDRGYTPEQPGPAEGARATPLWRALLPTALTLLMLVVFVLDMFRLGVRGLPEITVVLVAIGWLVYHFSGLRERWRS